MVKVIKKINLNKWKPLRNKYSPKYNVELRANDITILTDQALQVMIKTALEPEWEAIFQKYCYKLKKEQSYHDVIQCIYNLYNAQSIKNWIVKLNIQRGFDCISKDFMTKLFHSFPAKRIIQSWLNTGGGDFPRVKTQDTKFNRSLCMCLANIILYDLQKEIRISNNKREKIKDKNIIIHYKNEFIVACQTEEDALKIREVLNRGLHSRGLFTDNIKIQHITQGFNFLGFNIQLHNHSKYGKQKLTIKPSKESVLKIKNKLKKMWMKSNGSPVAKIIKKINPIIRKWAHYFKIGNSSKIFKLLDHFMYRRQWRFTRKQHSKKARKWIQQRYWRLLCLGHKNKWVFGCKETGAYMLKFLWIKNQRHLKKIYNFTGLFS
nr:hypothetical protein [Oedogonium angustistomum]